jgi:hypothetical protein
MPHDLFSKKPLGPDEDPQTTTPQPVKLRGPVFVVGQSADTSPVPASHGASPVVDQEKKTPPSWYRWLPALGVRLAGGALSAPMAAAGPLTSGLGSAGAFATGAGSELLAQMIEEGDPNPLHQLDKESLGRAALEGTISTVPASALLRRGKALWSAVRSGALGGVGEAAREKLRGEDLSPGSIAMATGLGAGTGALFSRFQHLEAPPVPPKPTDSLGALLDQITPKNAQGIRTPPADFNKFEADFNPDLQKYIRTKAQTIEQVMDDAKHIEGEGLPDVARAYRRAAVQTGQWDPKTFRKEATRLSAIGREDEAQQMRRAAAEVSLPGPGEELIYKDYQAANEAAKAQAQAEAKLAKLKGGKKQESVVVSSSGLDPDTGERITAATRYAPAKPKSGVGVKVPPVLQEPPEGVVPKPGVYQVVLKATGQVAKEFDNPKQWQAFMAQAGRPRELQTVFPTEVVERAQARAAEQAAQLKAAMAQLDGATSAAPAAVPVPTSPVPVPAVPVPDQPVSAVQGVAPIVAQPMANPVPNGGPVKLSQPMSTDDITQRLAEALGVPLPPPTNLETLAANPLPNGGPTVKATGKAPRPAAPIQEPAAIPPAPPAKGLAPTQESQIQSLQQQLPGEMIRADVAKTADPAQLAQWDDWVKRGYVGGDTRQFWADKLSQLSGEPQEAILSRTPAPPKAAAPIAEPPPVAAGKPVAGKAAGLGALTGEERGNIVAKVLRDQLPPEVADVMEPLAKQYQVARAAGDDQAQVFGAQLQVAARNAIKAGQMTKEQNSAVGKAIQQALQEAAGAKASNGPGVTLGMGFGGMQDILSRNPQLAMRLGLGALGAVVGAELDPADDPMVSAAFGAGIGFGAPSVLTLLKKVGVNAGGDPNIVQQLNTPQGRLSGGRLVWALLPNIQRFNYLMSVPGLAANAVAGPFGSGFWGAMTKAMAGDARGIAALKLFMGPQWFYEYRNGWGQARDLIARAEQGSPLLRAEVHGPVMSQLSPKVAQTLEFPGVAMSAGDQATRTLLKKAGFTELEARDITLTGEPVIPLFKKLVDLTRGKPSPTLDLLFPFKRTPLNIAEQGLLRVPVVGFYANAVRTRAGAMATPLREQIVQQALGGLIGTVAYYAGLTLPPEEARIIRRFVTNGAGQYSGLAAMGFAIGEAQQKTPGMSVPEAATSMHTALAAADYIPLPTADPIKQLFRAAGEVVRGKEDVHVPRGAMPAVFWESQPTKLQTGSKASWEKLSTGSDESLPDYLKR